jgi:hypothetical protein
VEVAIGITFSTFTSNAVPSLLHLNSFR